MTRKQILAWAAGVLLAGVLVALVAVAALRALELPPADGLPLAQLVQAVEKKDLGVIRSIEYERGWRHLGGVWEFDVCRGDTCFKLAMDAKSGDEIAREEDESANGLPPPGVQGPAAIARSFDERKLGVITEIEFDSGAWQVEFREARGLVGALVPNKRRVFEPAKKPVSSSPPAPRPSSRSKLIRL